MIRFLLLAVIAAASISVDAIAQTTTPIDLDDPDRPQEEKDRDALSKPIEMFTWIGVEPGDVVVDWHAGGGYATWILSRWVEPEGVVFAEMSEGRRKNELMERIESGDISTAGNTVFVHDIESLPSDSLDLFFVMRNYHDYEPDEIPEYLSQIARTLKPGGELVVVDTVTPEGRDVDGHRIAADVVIEEVTAGGFELLGSSDLLANPDDTYQGPQWDNRDELDHFILKFRWPGPAN